jgi:xanthine dehydrogenase YagS FAD-binding subunit
MNRFSWTSPKSVAEAAELASATVADAMSGNVATDARGPSLVKAGGTDLLDLMKEGLVEPARVVSLAALGELKTIVKGPDGALQLGSLVTLDRLARDAVVGERYPALARAAGASASPQIRNVATLGGNLLQRPRCWYLRAAEYHCLRKGGGHCFALTGENQYHAIFDNRPCAIVHPSTLATMLVALGASVVLADPEGRQRRLALEDFFVSVEKDAQRENVLQPQEILLHVELPPPAPATCMAYVRLGQKGAFDWPLVDAAVVLEFAADGGCRSARIVMGSVAPTPWRAREAERVIVGSHVEETVAIEAAGAAVRGATPLAKNAYKVTLARTIVQRALLEAAAGAPSATQPQRQ